MKSNNDNIKVYSNKMNSTCKNMHVKSNKLNSNSDK